MDPSIWWICFIILGLLACSAFFSGSETALTAVNRATMHRLAAQGSKGAKTALARFVQLDQRGKALLKNDEFWNQHTEVAELEQLLNE